MMNVTCELALIVAVADVGVAATKLGRGARHPNNNTQINRSGIDLNIVASLMG